MPIGNCKGVCRAGADCPQADEGAAWRIAKRALPSATAIVAQIVFVVPALAGSLSVESAWVAPNDSAGADVGLY